MKQFLTVILLVLCASAHAQVLTKEDSLTAGVIARNRATVLSGYGSLHYENNITTEQATVNVERIVLFLGHKFNKNISFLSEMELEDAHVSGGSPQGEFSLEQAFLKFNVNKRSYLTAGLFIPRIGIINENHLPNTFNGTLRPQVETNIIPATWREIGVGYYVSSKKVPGLNYSVAVVNGLSSANFTNGTGIKDGRFSGSKASASALAVTGSVLHYWRNFRTQASVYYGGSAGLTSREADSLQLNYGVFGTPVALTEANVQYRGERVSFKLLGTFTAIPDAANINRAYANNTPEQMLGAYAEVGYDFLKKNNHLARVFARYEYLDMNFKVASNGIYNGKNDQQYLTAGFCYLPTTGVIVKLDYTYRMTGDQNPALIVSPFPQGLPYFTQQHSFNLGLGYSF